MKKSNKCETILNDYISLDRGEAVPLKIWTHLLLCKKCRSEVRLLTLADKACVTPLTIEREPDQSLAVAIMLGMQNDPECENLFIPKEVSLKNWIISGIIMILTMIFFTINSYSQNTDIALPAYLVFAVFITGYCALFVASNLDFFIKKLENLEIKL